MAGKPGAAPLPHPPLDAGGALAQIGGGAWRLGHAGQMRRRAVRSGLGIILLPLAALVLTGCERLAEDYRKDRGVMKILRDGGEYRIVEEEF